MKKPKKIYLSVSLIITILLGIILFNKYLDLSSDGIKWKNNLEVDMYNIYYVIDIQDHLGELDDALIKKVNKNLKDKSLGDITNERLLGSLPSLWFYVKLTENSESLDIHKQESARFVRNLQQDDGLFILENSYVQDNKDFTVLDKLFPTKMSIDILQKYGEKIPKIKTLLNVVNNELDHRLNSVNNIRLDEETLLVLQILHKLDPQSEMMKKAKSIISIQTIQEKINNNLTNPIIVKDLIEIADILDLNVKFDSNLLKEIERSFNDLQLKNGAFPFPASNEPNLLSTHSAVIVMTTLDIEVKRKKELLEYTRDIAKNSFIN